MTTIRYEAKEQGARTVTVWGTGTPRREFLHSDDMGDACVFLMELADDAFEMTLKPRSEAPEPPPINIGCGQDLTVRGLAEVMRRVVSFSGDINWDLSKPEPRIGLEEGIVCAYRDFLSTRAGSVGSSPRAVSVKSSQET